MFKGFYFSEMQSNPIQHRLIIIFIIDICPANCRKYFKCLTCIYIYYAGVFIGSRSFLWEVGNTKTCREAASSHCPTHWLIITQVHVKANVARPIVISPHARATMSQLKMYTLISIKIESKKASGVVSIDIRINMYIVLCAQPKKTTTNE